MEAEKAFPSPDELEVSSALLLLSTCTTTTKITASLALSSKSEKSSKKKKVKYEKSSTMLSASSSKWSGSSSSSITTDNQSRMKRITRATNFHDMMKHKVVRKRRSKTICISDCRKTSSDEPKSKAEASTSASSSSCVTSSSSSAISSGRSRDIIRRYEHGPLLSFAEDSTPKPKPKLGYGHMWRVAESIFKVLTAHGSTSEVRIRELLGDSPSTSKALRILLNLKQVKRFGEGGRGDPFTYTIA